MFYLWQRFKRRNLSTDLFDTTVEDPNKILVGLLIQSMQLAHLEQDFDLKNFLPINTQLKWSNKRGQRINLELSWKIKESSLRGTDYSYWLDSTPENPTRLVDRNNWTDFKIDVTVDGNPFLVEENIQVNSPATAFVDAINTVRREIRNRDAAKALAKERQSSLDKIEKLLGTPEQQEALCYCDKAKRFICPTHAPAKKTIED